MSSVAVSVFRAAIRRPLRSKRAMTSPVRARSKASGLTRIRVRLTAWAPLFLFAGRRLFRGAAGGTFAGARRFGFGGGPARFVGGGRGGCRALFFARFTRTALRRRFFQLAVAFALALVARRTAAAAL